MMLAIVLVSLCTVSCGGDDDEEDALPNNENTKEVSTSTPKTITIGQTADSSCDIYAGYNNVYTLYVMDGYIDYYTKFVMEEYLVLKQKQALIKTNVVS